MKRADEKRAHATRQSTSRFLLWKRLSPEHLGHHTFSIVMDSSGIKTQFYRPLFEDSRECRILF